MSTEQEISGAERDTMRRELNYRVRSGGPIGFEQGWRACLEYDRDGANAERQRADMAEEREKGLRKRVEDLIIQLSKANDPINDYAVQTLMIALGDA